MSKNCYHQFPTVQLSSQRIGDPTEGATTLRRVRQDKALPNGVYRVCTGSISDREKRKEHVSFLWKQKISYTKDVYRFWDA